MVKIVIFIQLCSDTLPRPTWVHATELLVQLQRTGFCHVPSSLRPDFLVCGCCDRQVNRIGMNYTGRIAINGIFCIQVICWWPWSNPRDARLHEPDCSRFINSTSALRLPPTLEVMVPTKQDVNPDFTTFSLSATSAPAAASASATSAPAAASAASATDAKRKVVFISESQNFDDRLLFFVILLEYLTTNRPSSVT